MKQGKVDTLLGIVFGDEGKGKVVDFFTPHYDVPMPGTQLSLTERNLCFAPFLQAFSVRTKSISSATGALLLPIFSWLRQKNSKLPDTNLQIVFT